MCKRPQVGATLVAIYDALYHAYGPQHWWPGETRDEMMIGAVLTQNTAWTNVERAIERLRLAGKLTLAALNDLDEVTLSELIRQAGTYRVKARRLKALVGWVFDSFQGDLDAMFRTDADRLRESLLAVPGVGPETADAILLYAGGIPTFVGDAYTRRMCRRHFLVDSGARYEETRSLFADHLAPEAALYGEYHALLVALGKRHCRIRAVCDTCPLREFAHDATL